MKKSVAKAWVKALRSGDYKQGQEALRSGNNFCCLGVLCDISGIAKWESLERTVIVADKKSKMYIDDVDLLPKAVQEWAGMQSNEGIIGSAITCFQSLAELNDQGLSFAEIANLIEENVSKL